MRCQQWQGGRQRAAGMREWGMGRGSRRAEGRRTSSKEGRKAYERGEEGGEGKRREGRRRGGRATSEFSQRLECPSVPSGPTPACPHPPVRGNGKPTHRPLQPTCQSILPLRRSLSELLHTGAAKKMSFQEIGLPLELGSSPQALFMCNPGKPSVSLSSVFSLLQ